MTPYSLVLFAHVTAVLTLFGCFSLEALSLFHLRRASTLPEIQLWIESIPGLSGVALGSMLVILFSGIYMAIQMSGFGLAWIDVTMGALLLMAPLGAVTGKRTREIRRLSASVQTNQPKLSNLLQHPLLKISLGIRIAGFFGIVLLMTARPALTESLGILGVSVVLGLAATLLRPNKKPALSTAGTGARH